MLLFIRCFGRELLVPRKGSPLGWMYGPADPHPMAPAFELEWGRLTLSVARRPGRAERKRSR